jgi:hypothetical protein
VCISTTLNSTTLSGHECLACRESCLVESCPNYLPEYSVPVPTSGVYVDLNFVEKWSDLDEFCEFVRKNERDML